MAHFDIGNRLSIYGWKHEEEDFFFLLAKVFFKSGFRNVEQLLFNPSKGSLPFVEKVKELSKMSEIPEDEILHTLSNLRKNGYLKSVKSSIV